MSEFNGTLENLYESLIDEDFSGQEEVDDDGDLDLDVESILMEEDDEPGFEVADLVDVESFAEGKRREQANERRSKQNAQVNRMQSRQISKLSRTDKGLRKQVRLNTIRDRKRERQYRRDERRERLMFRSMSKRVDENQSRLESVEFQLMLFQILSIFSNRIETLRMSGNLEANPHDLYTVHEQNNNMIGLLLPIMLPLFTNMMGGQKGDSSGGMMMLLLFMMVFMGEGLGTNAFGSDVKRTTDIVTGGSTSNILILLLPLMMIMMNGQR